MGNYFLGRQWHGAGWWWSISSHICRCHLAGLPVQVAMLVHGATARLAGGDGEKRFDCYNDVGIKFGYYNVSCLQWWFRILPWVEVNLNLLILMVAAGAASVHLLWPCKRLRDKGRLPLGPFDYQHWSQQLLLEVSCLQIWCHLWSGHVAQDSGLLKFVKFSRVHNGFVVNFVQWL